VQRLQQHKPNQFEHQQWQLQQVAALAGEASAVVAATGVAERAISRSIRSEGACLKTECTSKHIN